jgi:iron complex transport system ATP-binding protein
MLTVKNLSVKTANSKILDDVSFDTDSGEIVCILGPNGSGKSTLIKTVLGLVKKHAGDILYDGADISGLRPKERARLFSYVPQNTAQSSLYTVLESVVMGRYAHLGRFERYSARDFEMALAAVARVGLSGFEDRIVSTLSGGEAARVACARAITQDTPVMMLDEPTSALDPKHSIAITSVIRELADEGRIILVTMHDINLALNCTDRLILLKGGRIYGETPSKAVGEELLRGLYDIPWEIWSVSDGKKLVAIPGDQLSSNISPFIS